MHFYISSPVFVIENDSMHVSQKSLVINTVFSIDALDKEGLRDLGVVAYGHILGILKHAKKTVATKRREELLVSFYITFISWHA